MSVPDPATTNWVPLQGRPSGAAYFGQYQSSGHTYYDGDCVIGSDGILYMCVVDGTITAPVAWPGAPAPQGVAGPQGPQGIGVPAPVVNGQWIKGVGGAAVWTAIGPADVAGANLMVADSGWVNVSTWYNGWGNYPGGANYPPARVRQLATGMVVMSGLLQGTTTANATAFQLPLARFWPNTYRHMCGWAVDAIGTVRIDGSNGVVSLQCSNGAYFTLDNVSYFPT